MINFELHQHCLNEQGLLYNIVENKTWIVELEIVQDAGRNFRTA